MKIGERIRKIRKGKGLKLKDFSERTGKDMSLLSRYETGAVKEIPASFLPSIASALGVSVEELFKESA